LAIKVYYNRLNYGYGHSFGHGAKTSPHLTPFAKRQGTQTAGEKRWSTPKLFGGQIPVHFVKECQIDVLINIKLIQGVNVRISDLRSEA
jgi:hypothetical protein